MFPLCRTPLPLFNRTSLWRLIALAGLLAMPLTSLADEPSPVSPSLQWDHLPDLPDPIGLGGPIVGVHDNVLLAAGGANFPQDPPWSVAGRPPGTKIWHDEIYALVNPPRPNPAAPERFEWIEAGRLPKPLAYAATISTRDGVYIFGGESFGVSPAATAGSAPAPFPTTEVLKLEWSWTARTVLITRDALPPLPRPCQYHAADAIGEHLYVVASHGVSPTSRQLDGKSFWTLDLSQPSAERRWTELPAWPGDAREKMALVAQSAPNAVQNERTRQQHLYLIGGSTWAKHADGSPDDAHATHFADGYRYDPAAQTWAPIAPLPFIPEQRTLDLAGYQWNAAANSWETADEAPSLTSAQLDDLFRSQGRPLGAAPAIAWGDLDVLILSGATGRYTTLPVQLRPFFPRDVLAYDTQSNTWRVAGEMPLGVVTTTAVRWGDRLVIPSGETRPGIRTPRVQSARTQ